MNVASYTAGLLGRWSAWPANVSEQRSEQQSWARGRDMLIDHMPRSRNLNGNHREWEREIGAVVVGFQPASHIVACDDLTHSPQRSVREKVAGRGIHPAFEVVPRRNPRATSTQHEHA